jgi:hypothetical protein
MGAFMGCRDGLAPIALAAREGTDVTLLRSDVEKCRAATKVPHCRLGHRTTVVGKATLAQDGRHEGSAGGLAGSSPRLRLVGVGL